MLRNAEKRFTTTFNQLTKMYTEEQINEFKSKADKWDALDEEIGEVYFQDEEDEEGADLAHIGELAAQAFGYL